MPQLGNLQFFRRTENRLDTSRSQRWQTYYYTSDILILHFLYAWSLLCYFGSDGEDHQTTHQDQHHCPSSVTFTTSLSQTSLRWCATSGKTMGIYSVYQWGSNGLLLSTARSIWEKYSCEGEKWPLTDHHVLCFDKAETKVNSTIIWFFLYCISVLLVSCNAFWQIVSIMIFLRVELAYFTCLKNKYEYFWS